MTPGALVLVGVGALIAAPVAGNLADRYGARPVMRVAILLLSLPFLRAIEAPARARVRVTPGGSCAWRNGHERITNQAHNAPHCLLAQSMVDAALTGPDASAQ